MSGDLKCFINVNAYDVFEQTMRNRRYTKHPVLLLYGTDNILLLTIWKHIYDTHIIVMIPRRDVRI